MNWGCLNWKATAWYSPLWFCFTASLLNHLHPSSLLAHMQTTVASTFSRTGYCWWCSKHQKNKGQLEVCLSPHAELHEGTLWPVVEYVWIVIVARYGLTAPRSSEPWKWGFCDLWTHLQHLSPVLAAKGLWIVQTETIRSIFRSQEPYHKRHEMSWVMRCHEMQGPNR